MKRYRINPDNDELTKDSELLKSFVRMDEKAFYSFKNDSDINRTLIKNNFKDKRKSKFQELVEQVIESERIDRQNQSTLKRLAGELKEIKEVNRA